VLCRRSGPLLFARSVISSSESLRAGREGHGPQEVRSVPEVLSLFVCVHIGMTEVGEGYVFDDYAQRTSCKGRSTWGHPTF